MTLTKTRIFRAGFIVMLAAALLLIPSPQRVAKAHDASTVTVDIVFTVHNSDIGVSEDVLDAAVEHVLDEASIHHVRHQADATSVHLKIGIYRHDEGFKIHGDLSGPAEVVENGDDQEEKECHAQDQIDRYGNRHRARLRPLHSSHGNEVTIQSDHLTLSGCFSFEEQLLLLLVPA